jgi:Domain of unknown function (DUF4386)
MMNIARIAGALYATTFVAGTIALVVRGALGSVAGSIAAASYVAVTLLLYFLFRPVNARLSLIAAVTSFAGIIVSIREFAGVNNLAFFGIYCLLIAYLLLRSNTAPTILVALMAFAGLGWLTFLSAPLARLLHPYNFAPGMIGEGALTIWLLGTRVNIRERRPPPAAAASHP